MTKSRKTALRRREWLAAALGAGAASATASQQPQAQPPEAIAAARQAVAGNLATLSQFPLSMATEPAAIFRV